jgi:hypothetical protein
MPRLRRRGGRIPQCPLVLWPLYFIVHPAETAHACLNTCLKANGAPYRALVTDPNESRAA